MSHKKTSRKKHQDKIPDTGATLAAKSSSVSFPAIGLEATTPSIKIPKESHFT